MPSSQSVAGSASIALVAFLAGDLQHTRACLASLHHITCTCSKHCCGVQWQPQEEGWSCLPQPQDLCSRLQRSFTPTQSPSRQLAAVTDCGTQALLSASLS